MLEIQQHSKTWIVGSSITEISGHELNTYA